MSNLADEIEKLILRKLAGESVILLKRNELADNLACAPSQISYVLTTRFTMDRGFIVESRRGSGGFVRIAKVPLEDVVYREANGQEEYPPNNISELIVDLAKQEILTRREAALMLEFLGIMSDYIEPQEQLPIVKRLLAAMF